MSILLDRVRTALGPQGSMLAGDAAGMLALAVLLFAGLHFA